MGSRPSGGGSSQNRLTRQLSARIQVQGERQAVRSLNRVDNAIEGVGSATAGTSSALGSAGASLTGFSQGIESSLGPIDEMFAGQRKLLGVAGDLTAMLAIGGGIVGAGLIPTLAGLVGVTVDATSETDKFTKSQEDAAAASEALASAIGTEAALLSLSSSAAFKRIQDQISALKAIGGEREAALAVLNETIEKEKARERGARRSADRLAREAKNTERSQDERDRLALASEGLKAAAKFKALVPLRSQAKAEAEIVVLNAQQERGAQKLLRLRRISARLQREAAEEVKAGFGEQLKQLELLQAKATGVLDFKAPGGAQKKTAIEELLIPDKGLDALLGDLNDFAEEASKMAELISVPFRERWEQDKALIASHMALVKFQEGETVAAQARISAQVSQTGQSFAAAAVDAAIFGASAKDAANAVLTQLTRQAAVKAIWEGAQALAMLGTFYWTGDPRALISAKAHGGAALAFAGIGAVAAAGASATGGLQGEGGASSAGASSAPTDADLPRSQGASGGGQETIIINYNPRGQAVHTADQVGQAITEALDSYSRTRGRSRANLAQLQRRGV